MCRERTSASRSLRRWTAPRRRVCYLGKEQYRHKARSYPTVQSSACSELLAPRGKDRPEKNASWGNSDKDPTGQQGRRKSKEVGRLKEKEVSKTPNAEAKRRFENLQ